VLARRRRPSKRLPSLRSLGALVGYQWRLWQAMHGQVALLPKLRSCWLRAIKLLQVVRPLPGSEPPMVTAQAHLSQLVWHANGPGAIIAPDGPALSDTATKSQGVQLCIAATAGAAVAQRSRPLKCEAWQRRTVPKLLKLREPVSPHCRVGLHKS
jgi:hypothetical protein